MKFNQNAGTCLVQNKAQCSGIARAIKYLCDYIGLWCIVITGDIDDKATHTVGPHAWNIVRIDGKYYHLVPAHKVAAVDTTAAGDIFTAAMTYAYLQKGDILEAARFATLAAAICVSRKGASTSIPTLKEVKAFAKSIKEAK